MKKPISISMRGSRWIISLDAEAFASLYALVLLDEEIRKMPLGRAAFSFESTSKRTLKAAIRSEVERVRRRVSQSSPSTLQPSTK